MIAVKLIQTAMDYIIRQVEISDLKMESGRPKGTIVTNMELGDCLSVGAYSTYGNGVLVVGRGISTLLKGDRRNLFKRSSQYNGIRYYSKAVAQGILPIKTAKGGLPRKFEKLVNICSEPNEDMKISNIYNLMFNVRMYEVAYHKLKSNPGNTTPGINPVILDGFSEE